MYTTSFAFFEALWEAGVTHCFVNLGSDHPSIMEAIVKGQKEHTDNFPRIITCPNEMVAVSMADGYARLTNKPQAVIVHVDVGTSGMGAAMHNASAGKSPVLVFAGLSPATIEGEYSGSRTEYIHWLQDVPDQKQIVSQYCRYVGEIKKGKNVKQLVNRALSWATSDPKGPVYLTGTREAMEEEIHPYSLNQAVWTPSENGVLSSTQLTMVSEAIVLARRPLIIVGYGARDHTLVGALFELAEVVKSIRVLDTAGSDMCFPADHCAWLGLRYGIDPHITTADVIIVIDCDVPWINTQCKPDERAKVFHLDSDPLKQSMGVFYIDASARFRVNSALTVAQITAYVKTKFASGVRLQRFEEQRALLRQEHVSRLQGIAAAASPLPNGLLNCAHLISEVKKVCPADTIWVVEAVTNSEIVADQIQATEPGTWIGCGGGGLGWSGGAALGVKLATDKLASGGRKGRFVCQIVGDGSYLFSVPSSVYWIAQRYDIPIMTVVLDNKGWNAPRKSLLLVHPHGLGSQVTNEELNIAFTPSPDYAGIAAAASCHKAWTGEVSTVADLHRILPAAVESVKAGRPAVLSARLAI